MSINRSFRLACILLLGVMLLSYSNVPPRDETERVRAFTRSLEFDYLSWVLDAFQIKVFQSALGADSYIPNHDKHDVMMDYLNLVRDIQQTEANLNRIYADPDIPDPQQASTSIRQQLNEMYAHRARLGPLAESILQGQIEAIAGELGLSLGGQTIPPVLYHSTPLPTALIVSPRNVIRQQTNISLISDMTVDRRAALEKQVDEALDVSSLVVDIGGIGVYPTMVIQTSDLNYLADVVAHEWIHNYLTLRPLGISYENSAELRTMNETTASIAGKEIGRALIERYYPELLPPPPVSSAQTTPETPPPPPTFDYRAEMHATRVIVDTLLRVGKITLAESFMEQRRIEFWEHGYQIRKLNQAYFAFYGAYADLPGGAAGADPVGAAVRALRSQSRSLAAFVNRISWMTSFEQLQRAVEGTSSLNLPPTSLSLANMEAGDR